LINLIIGDQKFMQSDESQAGIFYKKGIASSTSFDKEIVLAWDIENWYSSKFTFAQLILIQFQQRYPS
jgi:hypothetical protein